MRHKDDVPANDLPDLAPLPRVTIQLPIFNEMYVVDRLVDAVCRIDYPKELLEIQVLDDSTDETTAVSELAVRRWAAQGFDIKFLHRTDRTGYKAGALDEGLKVATGQFVAIFDADFVPTGELPAEDPPALRQPEGRHGAGALGAHQPRVLAADPDPVDPAGRPLRPRARQPQPVGLLLQFQRDGRDLAPGGHRRRRRVAARHADRGPRPELPDAARGLEVRVPAGPGGRRPRCRSR